MQQDFADLVRLFRQSNKEIVGIINDAIQTGAINIPPRNQSITYAAGGTNMCPNSDFAFSYLAATIENTLPANTASDNSRVYRVWKQGIEADTYYLPADNANLVATAALSGADDPVWDKVQGVIGLGNTSSGSNKDIAIQFTNNWLVPNRRWYVRVAVALDDDTPLPEGVKIFAGFWVRRSSSQAWVTGDPFTLSYEVKGTAGTVHHRYKVIAKTSSGRTIESAVLNVTDVPTTLGGLSSDNKILITYPGAVGFIEFLLYREIVATGQVDLIAWDRNSTRLFAYDTGQSIRFEPAGFPSTSVNEFRAYEEVAIDAVSINIQKTFHDFVIQIPPNFDTSDVQREGTYLRIGILGDVAHNNQVLVDTVWASESYNVWSANPLDDYPSQPSTTMISGPPGGSGPVEGPPESGGTCVWEGHDLLMGDGSILLKDLKAGDQTATDEGANSVRDIIDGEVSQYMEITFDNGLVIKCTPVHRFIRSFADGSGLMAMSLKPGDQVMGSFCRLGKREDAVVTVTDIELCNSTPIKVRTPQMTIRSRNRFFAVGDTTSGSFVWCHNAKQT